MGIHENPPTFGGYPVRRVVIRDGQVVVRRAGAATDEEQEEQEELEKLASLDDPGEPAAYEIRVDERGDSLAGCCLAQVLAGDCGPFLAAAPQLKLLKVRGAETRLHQLPRGLRELVVESGGMARELLQDLGDADLPKLERLDMLDLSLGCVSDEGAELLASCAAARRLRRLRLNYHYISDKWQQRLRDRLEPHVELELSQPMGPEDFDDDGAPLRYCAVGE